MMQNFAKFAIVLILLSIILAPGAQGISVSISTASSGFNTYSSIKPSSGPTDSFRYNAVIAMNDYVSIEGTGIGPMPEEHHVLYDPTTGNSAGVYARVDGDGSTTWSYDWSTDGTNGDYVHAQEWLTATNAAHIAAHANSSNARGHTAYAGMDVYGGFVNNYHAESSATASQTIAQQKSDGAGGERIIASMDSNNDRGCYAESITRIKSGTIHKAGNLPGYSGRALAKDSCAQIDMYNLNAIATGGTIRHSTMAEDMGLDGRTATAAAEVYKGSLSKYTDSIYSTPTTAKVGQNIYSASGSQIIFYTEGSNTEWDHAYSRTDIRTGSVQGSSSAPGYKASAYATDTAARVDVYNLKASASQGTISQLLQASNYYDSSYVRTIINKGALYTYPYSSSYPARAYASNFDDKTYAVQSSYMYGARVRTAASANSWFDESALKPSDDKAVKVKIGNKASTASTSISAVTKKL